MIVESSISTERKQPFGLRYVNATSGSTGPAEGTNLSSHLPTNFPLIKTIH